VKKEFIDALKRINSCLRIKVKLTWNKNKRLEMKLRKGLLKAFIHQKNQRDLDINFELTKDIKELYIARFKKDFLNREMRIAKFVKIKNYSENNVSASTFIGERRTNQDSFLMDQKSSRKFFGVFDGHGYKGKKISEFVAKNTVSCFLEELKKNCKNKENFKEKLAIVKSLKDVFKRVDKKLTKKIRNRKEYGGSTACLVVICKDNNKKKIFVSNVGDSRACLYRDGKVIQLTKDQKGDYEFFDGTEINCKRAVGLDDFRGYNGRVAKARVTYLEVDVYEEDSFLVIGSDGLHDYFSSNQLGKVMRRMREGNFSLKEMANNFISCAIQGYNRGRVRADNITVLVVKLLREIEIFF
jgi:serine/threonine protein phosphatase PrpC